MFQAMKRENRSSSSSSDPKIENPEKKVVVVTVDQMVDNNNFEKKLTSCDAARSNIFIHFDTRNNKNIEKPATDTRD